MSFFPTDHSFVSFTPWYTEHYVNENKTNSHTPKKNHSIESCHYSSEARSRSFESMTLLFLALPPASDVFLQLPTLSLMRTLNGQQFWHRGTGQLITPAVFVIFYCMSFYWKSDIPLLPVVKYYIYFVYVCGRGRVDVEFDIPFDTLNHTS